MAELEEMLQIGQEGFAEQCSNEVQKGIRSQKILVKMKSLRTELHLCQFRTLKSDLSMEPATPKKHKVQQDIVDPMKRLERPLPEWITREMQNVKPLTAEKRHRLKLQKESNLLTLAGRVLSMPSMDMTPRYHEIFNLHSTESSERADNHKSANEKAKPTSALTHLQPIHQESELHSSPAGCEI